MHPRSLRALAALLVLAAVAPLASARQSAQPLLFERPAFGASADPTAIVFGDLDGDGREDAVQADLSTDGLQVRLQSEPLAFGTPAFFDPGTAFEDVTLGDIDADGDLDLVAVESGASGSAHVLRGDGAGGFGAPDLVPLGASAAAVRTTDLDADGDLDVVTALSDLGVVGVLLGNGDGTFGPLATYAADLGALDLDIGDVDADGTPDVVTANGTTGSVAILRGDGTGGFLTPVLRPALSPAGARLTDIDGDGDLDIVTASLVTDSLAVLTNLGGSFGGFVQYKILAAALSVDIGDVDGDGAVDAVVGYGGFAYDYTTYEFSVMKGDGAGGFQLAAAVGNSNLSDPATGIELDDVDGDGILDVTTQMPYRNASVLHLGDGSGGFRGPLPIALGLQPRAIRVGDLDGDGIPDLVAANQGNSVLALGSVMTLLGDGSGGFLPPLELPSRPDLLELADFTNDGFLDVVYRPQGNNQLCIATGAGDGTVTFTSCLNLGGFATDFEPGDIDGDGNVDVVSTDSALGSVLVSPGNGDGTLQSGGATVAVGGRPKALTLSDLDRDGDLDVVVADGSALLVTLRNDGSGDVSTRVDVPVPTSLASKVSAADMDLDGQVDLVTDGSSTIDLVPGVGAGSFGTPRAYPFSQGGFELVADVNRDGFPDAVGMAAALVTVALNDGAGGFHATVSNHAGLYLPRDERAADLDGDGWDELLLVDGAGTVCVYYGLAPGTAQAIVRNGSGTNPLVYASTSPPLLGGAWTVAVDASAYPAASATAVVATDRGLAGLPTPFGELLVAVEPLGDVLGTSLQPVVGGASSHAFPLPGDPALVGMRVATQAALLGGGVVLANAVDAVLGDS